MMGKGFIQRGVGGALFRAGTSARQDRTYNGPPTEAAQVGT